MAVEARMTCGPVQKYPPQGTHTLESEDGKTGETIQLQQHEVKLNAVYSDDPDDPNHEWAVFTPSAEFRLTIMNPEAAKYFEPGQDYRVVITKMQSQKGVDTDTDSGNYLDEDSSVA